jgi:hypothetical protein
MACSCRLLVFLKRSLFEILSNRNPHPAQNRTKSNEIRYLLVNATTRRDAENHIVGVVGVAQVIECTRTVALLRKYPHLLTLIFI